MQFQLQVAMVSINITQLKAAIQAQRQFWILHIKEVVKKVVPLEKQIQLAYGHENTGTILLTKHKRVCCLKVKDRRCTVNLM